MLRINIFITRKYPSFPFSRQRRQTETTGVKPVVGHSDNVSFGGVCLKKSEPILRRTPTNEDAPPPPRGLGGHQRKMFLAFRICTRPISSKKERTFFFDVLPSKYSGRWRGDNSIRSGMAEFPPHPPSAMPSLGRTDFSAAANYLLLKISSAFRLPVARNSILPSSSLSI